MKLTARQAFIWQLHIQDTSRNSSVLASRRRIYLMLQVLELWWQCRAQPQTVITGQPLRRLFYCSFFISRTLFSIP